MFLNYQILSREIMTSLRKNIFKLSQRDLSVKAGYNFNQVGKWEAGSTQFYWQDFIKLCDLQGIPWREHTEKVFLLNGFRENENFSILTILQQFTGSHDIETLAETLQKSRSSVQRLMHNKIKFDFIDVLRLMDIRPFVLQSWLSRFLDPKSLPSFASKFENEEKMMKSILSIPWAASVNAALRLEEYNKLTEHSDEWIASHTGLQASEVKTAIQKLYETGVITKKDGKYNGFFEEFTMMGVPEFRKVTQYLNETFTKHFHSDRPSQPDPLNPSISSTRIYPISSEASRELAKAVIDFHHTVSSILKSDKGKKNQVRAILLHSLDMSILSDEVKASESASLPPIKQSFGERPSNKSEITT